MYYINTMLDRHDAGLGLIENTDEWSYGNVVDEMRTSLILFHGPDSKPMDYCPWEAVAQMGAAGLIKAFLYRKLLKVRKLNSRLCAEEAYDLAFALCESAGDIREFMKLADREYNKGRMTRQTHTDVIGALMALRINMRL